MAGKKPYDFITNIMLVVVSVVLVVFVSTSFTVAWFSSYDIAVGKISMSGAVIVEVANSTHALVENEPLKIDYNGDELVPGIKIVPTIYASLKKTQTAAVLRARIDTYVEGLSQELNEQLKEWLINTYSQQIDYAWRLYEEDGWYYFLGSSTSHTMIMTEPANYSSLKQAIYGVTYANYIPSYTRLLENENTVVGSVASPDADVLIPFLTKAFRLPYQIDNRFANATITMNFYVEALQDFILDENEDNVLPTVKNVKRIFDSLTTTHDQYGNFIG